MTSLGYYITASDISFLHIIMASTHISSSFVRLRPKEGQNRPQVGQVPAFSDHISVYFGLPKSDIPDCINATDMYNLMKVTWRRDVKFGIRIESDWPQIEQIWDFSDQISVYFVSPSQNILKSNFKKSQICQLRCISDPHWAKIWYCLSRSREWLVVFS